MVAVATSPSSLQVLSSPGKGDDGVVRIRVGNKYGSGVLLSDGRHILTAAHLTAGMASSDISVTFQTTSGTTSLGVSQVDQAPEYIAVNSNNDLAILTLTSEAPVTANRYTLYRNSNEVGKPIDIVGYGDAATGALGKLTDVTPATRRVAGNQVDGFMEIFKLYYGQYMNWSPIGDKLFFADFDDGSSAHDASGRFFGLTNTGIGSLEGGLSPGDSGGPAFIAGKIAGIATYQFRFTPGGISPDIDTQTNSSFGEISTWTRISQYQYWIDNTLRHYQSGAPSKPSEVKTSVVEGNSGTIQAWFLVSLAQVAKGGESVSYHTEDVTAKSGIDYLGITDTVVFYPGEDHVAIPVEIMGNTRIEGNRTFKLVITNPVGAEFPGGVTQLAAMRTIMDDDNPLQLVGVNAMQVLTV